MTELDAFSVPLAGKNIVEAGAGTGKTYSIQTIAARLIVEKGIPCERICVVTFTKEATAELLRRLREILEDIAAICNGMPENMIKPDEVLRAKTIISGAEAAGVDRQLICDRINQAVTDFDTMRISTIHGFCFRILNEFAVEGRGRLSLELKENSDGILLKCFEDFQRQELYKGGGSKKVGLLWQMFDFSPGGLLEKLKKVCISEVVPFWGKACKPDTAVAAADIAAGVFAAAEDCYKTLPLTDIEKLLNYTASKKDLKNLLDIEYLRPGLEAFYCRVLAGAREYVIREFRKRMDADGAVDNDTMLSSLRDKLTYGEAGRMMAKAVAGRFDALFVDEFQDTDPVQLEIFSAVCRQMSPEAVSFFIGDPKQAIYAFRGGDIYCYLRGFNEIPEENRYTLSTNRRSGKRLVEGVNNIFNGLFSPFAMPEIKYISAGCSQVDDGIFLGKEELPAVSFMEINSGDIALEINSMLMETNCKIFIAREKLDKPRRLKPSDFAILVKKNDDCFPLADALHKYGIPTIIYNAENALKAKEINDFIDLLQAFLAPSDTSRWVRVLSGMYFKNTAEQLAEYIASGKVEEDVKKNIQLLSLWEEYSLEAMFQEADNHYKISRTLLEQQNGRRLWVLTRKWLDLAAKLEEEETPAPDMLLARFRRELMPGQCSFSEDECSIQLHDDDEAVKIMSIHKSKGLQFPVVFVYDVSLEITKKRSKLFHAEEECCLDLSLNNDMKDICAAEEISELMRLAYVAVTRAQVMFRGGIKTTRLQKASFVNFVRTNPDLAESTQDWRLSLHKGLQKKGDQEKISTSLPELSFSFEPYGKEKSDLGLKCRTWNDPPLLSGWDRTSFSALTAAASHEQELYFNETADDYEDNEQKANVSANTLFERLAQFPAGARTGNAWHEILAELAFNSSSRHTGACVRETVDRYALVTEQEKTLTDAVAEMLTELFTMPLPGEYGGFPLAEISWNERVNEMEFTVAAHVETALTDICKSLPEYGMKSRAAVLRKASVVSGAMDLVFRRNGRYYLADWKSNRLGMVPEAYAPEQLEEAMRNKYYILQALIYLDMLRRYLRWDKEKYENEFGGIYYFFLRGCSPEVPGRGVWYHKPSWETLERIEKVLAGDDC